MLVLLERLPCLLVGYYFVETGVAVCITFLTFCRLGNST